MQHSERRGGAINTPRFFHSRSHLVVGFCSCLTPRTPLFSQSSCAYLRSILLLGFLLYRLCIRCGRHPVSLIAAILATTFFIVLQLRKGDRHGTETDLDKARNSHTTSASLHLLSTLSQQFLMLEHWRVVKPARGSRCETDAPTSPSETRAFYDDCIPFERGWRRSPGQMLRNGRSRYIELRPC